uniref:Calponin family repeat-containing domain protein n=1 Tax=Plectus sambesii TaxID=2011161 RepID=A0A914XC43_9BILA
MPPPWANRAPAPVHRRLSEAQEVTMGVQGTVSSPKTKGNFSFTNEAAQVQPSTGLKIAGAQTFQPHGDQQAPRKEGGKKFTMQQLRQTDGLVPLQSGTNQYDSQKGMTGFGTPRNTSTRVTSSNPDFPPTDHLDDERQTYGRWSVQQLRATDGIVRLQSGTNQYDSQRGMTGFGTPRDVKGKHMKRIWELMYPEEAEHLLDNVVNSSQPQST